MELNNFEIAVKVIGWTKIETHHTKGKHVWTDPKGKFCTDMGVPDYTTNVLAAWEVVETMLEDGCDTAAVSYVQSQGKWAAQFHKPNGRFVSCQGDTPAEAICRAALEFKNGEQGLNLT